LDGQGDANAIWVFQMASSLTVGTPGFPRSINLINGAQTKNVFWQVGRWRHHGGHHHRFRRSHVLYRRQCSDNHARWQSVGARCVSDHGEHRDQRSHSVRRKLVEKEAQTGLMNAKRGSSARVAASRHSSRGVITYKTGTAIVLSVDGTPTGSLPLFAHSLYLHGSGERAKIEVLRGSDRLQLDVPLVERAHQAHSLAGIADPVNNLVRPLGILGIELNLDLARDLPNLRIPTGVVVAAKTLGATDGEVPLVTGDVIHGLNGTSITNLAGLRDGLAKLKPGDAVALLIERYTQLIYVSFLL